MISQDITVKQRNGLNDCNQGLKLLFSEFHINQGGVAYATEHGALIGRGVTFAVVKESKMAEVLGLLPIDLYEGVTVNTRDVYTVVKDNKKKIQKVYVGEGKIGFCDTDGVDKFPFASTIEKRTNHMDVQEAHIAEAVKNIKEADLKYTLKAEDLDKLRNDELLKLSTGEYQVRLTKEITPLLTKTVSECSVYFKELAEKKFGMYIFHEFGGMMIYHKYTVVHY